MSTGGLGTYCHRNIAENLNRLSRAHERYRQTTDGRAIAYSEREGEFTFAKNCQLLTEVGGAVVVNHRIIGLLLTARRTRHFVTCLQSIQVNTPQ